MNKFFKVLLLLSVVCQFTFAQTSGIPYQAVIMDKDAEQELPGFDNNYVNPLRNSLVSIRFSIHDASGMEFEEIQNQQVLIGRDVATLYGVETRDINKAVKNNLDKFPKDYILELSDTEKYELVENFHHLEPLKYSKTNPKAFTEKGLYMLATILKSKQATQTTFLIIETFAKLRALQQTVATAAIEPRACRRCSFRLHLGYAR